MKGGIPCFAMESEVKQRTQRNRRRERAARMQRQQKERQAKGGDEGGSGEDGDESPARETPQRPPNRKKRNKEPMYEEDFIDGFAIISFKTYEDLEVSELCVCVLFEREVAFFWRLDRVG